MEASRRVIAAATIPEERLPTCPWRAQSDPYLRTVLDAHRSCMSGDNPAPALLLPSDPSPAVWEGLHHYIYLVRKLRADELEKQRKKAAQRGRPDRVRDKG